MDKTWELPLLWHWLAVDLVTTVHFATFLQDGRILEGQLSVERRAESATALVIVAYDAGDIKVCRVLGQRSLP